MWIAFSVTLFFILSVAALFLFLKIREERRGRAASNQKEEEGSSGPLNQATLSLRDVALGIFLPFVVLAVSSLLRTFYLPAKPWHEGTLRFFMLIFFSLVLFIYALYICRKRGLWPLFHPVPSGKILPMVLNTFLTALAIKLLVGMTFILLQSLFSQDLALPDYSILTTAVPNPLISLLLILMGFTVAPVVEEVYFRGFLYNGLKIHLTLFSAAVIQAVLFAAVHGAGFMVSILYFVSGLALAAVYENRRELISPILVHAFINAMALVPIFIMILQNFHFPASNWEEARTLPSWLRSQPPGWIEKKEDGMKQWEYAIETWGSKGSKQWKKEANAFYAVCAWFPEERAACAKAKGGIVSIYVYQLKDYRRAVFEADRLISEFLDQEEEVEAALARRGIAYLMLQDLEKSRRSFEKVIREGGEYPSSHQEAEKGIKWLDRIEGKEKIDLRSF